METSFSIVMPNYNSLYLRRAIKSVINQTRKNWELITVDNNSSNFPEKTIEEVNKKIHIDDGYVLYDFRTLNEYKNKKLYKLLLNNIISDKKGPLYIYSLSFNKKV